ncbi:winged helix-turn-helix domain-containing protein [Chitinophaga tropicalis]|uniref:Winged helix-turn-helix domain-containing protein n=1 Tax=Chitinophaga tropicalis TaxID=2683588 RepID=A0A7K1UF03_9BACT|nr:crosslink repair DNA glycosylase YcaQ family protein [Chitinophaga tropicalis]MVT12565.1 winged helix-turn-helix domain-containing protein [Chitinophaga tropicalis]
MNQFVITKQQARKIILHAAGLSKPAQFGKGREAVYKLIDHLGFVQIDTNYVVERAHHHSIAARVPDYKPEWLGELQADGRIFEFFTSDAGYLPMHNFRYSLNVKQAFSAGRKPLTQPEINLMNKVLDRIAREGPLMVKDFENDRQEPSAGWWDWRPSKVALERLYLDGKLMVTRTKEFLKVYDLSRNLIPDDVDTTLPTPEEFARHVIQRELKALGIAYAKEVAWRSRHLKNNLVKKELEKLVEEGEVYSVQIEGVKTAPLYMLPAYKNKKIQLSDDVFILSPFDVLNVFRHRLRDFFDFEYQIECFVPEPKRKYGYFSLPVLAGDTFVARMDSKADRKQRVLIIHNLHFEPVELSKPMIAKIIDAIQAFAKFNQCLDVVIKKSNNRQYLKAIKEGL